MVSDFVFRVKLGFGRVLGSAALRLGALGCGDKICGCLQEEDFGSFKRPDLDPIILLRF